jgi:hypothetical protein
MEPSLQEFSMQRVISAKSLLAVSIAFGSLIAATGARAQGVSNDFISVTVGTALHRVESAPVHAAPVQPRHVQAPDRHDHARGPWGDVDRDGVPNRYDRHDDRRVAAAGPWGDADRDGVPNRYDRAPYNPRFR